MLRDRDIKNRGPCRPHSIGGGVDYVSIGTVTVGGKVGPVSHEQAVGKATVEYKKYQQRTLSDVEKAYLDTIKLLESKTKS